ncbi:MAG: pyridoxal-phosphate dependent enzyme [Gammaproteobacteria bacterium]
MSIFDYFSEKIGNTDLKLVYSSSRKARVYAKCEWQNCFGSIKDRAALAMIKHAVKINPKLLAGEEKLIEYSGGNLAISLAGICNHLGIDLTLVLPSGVPYSYQHSLETNFRVRVITVDSKLGFLGVLNYAKKISKKNKRYHFLYQHNNKENINCHRITTAHEIILQAKDLSLSNIDAFVSSIGTGASLIGTYRGLLDNGCKPSLFSTMPFEMPYGTLKAPSGTKKFAGSGGLGYGIKQPLVKEYEHAIQHHFLYSIEQCYQQMLEYYEETGTIIGSSSAANLLAAKSIAGRLPSSCNILTLFPSLAIPEEIKLFGIKS